MSLTKQKRKRLSIMDKVSIINRIESGTLQIHVAGEYGVAHSVISGIMKNKDNIIKYSKKHEGRLQNFNKKKMDHIDESPLEMAIFQWFLQQTSLGNSVSGPQLREKALYFNQKLNGSTSFKASDGWLSRFKNRHGIKAMNVKVEKMSSDAEANPTFCSYFNKYIEDAGIDLENVYNANETGLCWKTLPRRTLSHVQEKETPGHKVPKDRVAVLTCANATGTHKIPLLLIGKSAQPHCFKNIVHLPLEYRSTKNAEITQQLFEDWFRNIFIPSVQGRKSEETERFVLLLDNTPSHPTLDRLNAINPNFTVIYLPPNEMAPIQPMDQGVIGAMKREYKKRFLQRLLLLNTEDKETVLTFVKKWSLLDCCKTVANAWNMVSETTLKKAWEKILFGSTFERHEDTQEHNIIALCNRLSSVDEWSTQEVMEWMDEDSTVSTYRYLPDENIVHLCNGTLPHIDAISLKVEHGQEEEDDNNDNLEDEKLTALDAITAVELLTRWCERRWDYTDRQINNLQEIQDATMEIAIDDMLANPRERRK